MLGIRLKYRLLGIKVCFLVKNLFGVKLMIKDCLQLHALVLLSFYSVAQTDLPSDTLRHLGPVVIQSYHYNRPLMETPASVGVIDTKVLKRFNEATLIPSFNTIPGIRLEERSPGSYRISIRGSTIRSPFGVRNVKVYWNNIPLTDPGGNTYLNQLDPAMFGSSEIIKGPASSLYGAGTGGVLLLNSPVIPDGHLIKSGLQVGSFGSEILHLSYEGAKNKISHQVQVLHQQADGYRNQTRMSRDVVNSVFHFEMGNDQQLETFIFYSDLFYETPGGLTLAEFQSNPRQARPATAFLPGAEEQQASVHLQSFFIGVTHEYFFNKQLHNRTSIYGNLVKFENAAIRNYDHRHEQSFGARSVTTFNYASGNTRLTLLGGGEFQWGFLPTKSYQNLQGKEGALLADDEARVFQVIAFGQGELRWKKFSVTAGLSYTLQHLNFHRLSDVDSSPEELKYDPELMPRLAFLWSAHKNISVFGSVSRGFSPPTLAEINASNGVFNRTLGAETGTNYEVGVRSEPNQKLKTEITVYAFQLRETIVIRREEDGAEYFVNAGNADQKGIEFSLSYNLVKQKNNAISEANFWMAYAYNYYRFKNYQKDADDFSGNQLTGSPDHVLSFGFDMESRGGVYLRATCLYSGKLPLNDANSVYADSYLLPGLRIGYKQRHLEVYAGGENLLNEAYSLGNDLNAVGGRFYNAAPGRSFYGGVKVNLAFQ
jgi:iron complex outermembrane recepter protein